MSISLEGKRVNCQLCGKETLYTIHIKEYELAVCPNCLTKALVDLSKTHYDYILNDLLKELKCDKNFWDRSCIIEEESKNEKNPLEDEVNYLNSELEDRELEVTELSDQIESLNYQIDTLKEEKEELVGSVKELTHKLRGEEADDCN